MKDLQNLIKQKEADLKKFVEQVNIQAAERRGEIAGLKTALAVSKKIEAAPAEDLPHDMSVEA